MPEQAGRRLHAVGVSSGLHLGKRGALFVGAVLFTMPGCVCAVPVGYKTPNLNPRGYRSPAERGKIHTLLSVETGFCDFVVIRRCSLFGSFRHSLQGCVIHYSRRR